MRIWTSSSVRYSVSTWQIANTLIFNLFFSTISIIQVTWKSNKNKIHQGFIRNTHGWSNLGREKWWESITFWKLWETRQTSPTPVENWQSLYKISVHSKRWAWRDNLHAKSEPFWWNRNHNRWHKCSYWKWEKTITTFSFKLNQNSLTRWSNMKIY